MRLARWVQVVAALLAASSSAQACIVSVPLKSEDIRQAEVVVVGTLTDYRIVSPGKPGTLSDYAILTVGTDRTLKGKVPATVRFSWDNSTFSEPSSMRPGARIIVAGLNPGARQPPLRGPSATVFAAPRNDMLRVLQAPCSSAFIFPHTPKLEADLNALLRGENIERIDTSGDEKLFLSEPAPLFRRELVPVVAASIGLTAFAAAGFFMLRKLARRRQGG